MSVKVFSFNVKNGGFPDIFIKGVFPIANGINCKLILLVILGEIKTHFLERGTILRVCMEGLLAKH